MFKIFNIVICAIFVQNCCCSQIARDLVLYLEQYGRVLMKQIRKPVDWLADPKRRNNTWEPWMNSRATICVQNIGTIYVNLAYYIHVSIIFISILMNNFVWSYNICIIFRDGWIIAASINYQNSIDLISNETMF